MTLPRPSRYPAARPHVLGAVDRGLQRLIEAYLPRLEPRSYLWDMVADYPSRRGSLARGKLCLATTEALGGSIRRAAPTAAALELFWISGLVQRDTAEDRPTRRGRPSLHRLHGMPLAINAGATLGLVALRPLIDNIRQVGDSLALRVAHQSFATVTQAIDGAFREQAWRSRGWSKVSVREYFDLASRARILPEVVLPCRLGVLLAEVEEDHGFERFACALGAARVLADELFDLGSSGQPLLRRRQQTLPLVLLSHRLPTRDQATFEALFRDPRRDLPPHDRRWLVRRMRATGVLEDCRTIALGFARRASRLADTVLDRSRASPGAVFLRGRAKTLHRRLSRPPRRPLPRSAALEDSP